MNNTFGDVSSLTLLLLLLLYCFAVINSFQQQKKIMQVKFSSKWEKNYD